MEPYIKTLLDFLQNILAQVGVAEASRPFGAMLVLYLSVTLLILLLVVVLWRSVWRKSAPSAGDEIPGDEVVDTLVEAEIEAEVTTSVDAQSAPPVVEQETEQLAADGLIKTVRSGLEKTRTSLIGRLESLFKGKQVFSAELLEELEEVLITSDFGMATTMSLVNALEQRFSGTEATSEEVYGALKKEIADRIKAVDTPATTIDSYPEVVMVVGVNGVGKTTTIGKLAGQYCAEGKSVLLAAGDTFRAAAAEQLSVWAQRAGADIVKHGDGGDPAAVTFDAAKAAIARKSEMLIVDTAGRLHTKTNLMEELKKIRRVLDREISGAPHSTLLVVDATTGQNALVQAKMFQAAVQVDGIILTKLDGTAKGGVIVAICSELNIPVRFIGVGEGLHDLRPFDADEFVEALFGVDEVA
jgi:fused signal recognition particle receptor